MNVLFWRRRHAVSDTDLNAYVDRQLAPAARDRVEEHLRACASCRETVEGLSALGTALRELPRARAPRSFALRQEDVSPPISEPQRPWFGRLPAFAGAPSLAGGVAVFAFVAFWTLVSVDVLTQDSGGGAADGASQMRQGLPSGESAAEMDAMLPSAPGAVDYSSDGSTAGAAEGEPAVTPIAGATGRDEEVVEGLPDNAMPLMPSDDVAPRDAAEPPAPEESPPVTEGAADGGDGIAPLRVAEAVAAAAVLLALASFAWLRWRRRA